MLLSSGILFFLIFMLAEVQLLGAWKHLGWTITQLECVSWSYASTYTELKHEDFALAHQLPFGKLESS